MGDRARRVLAQRLLLWDQTAVDRWAQERLLYQDAQAFAEPLHAVADRARESLREGWLARETEIARRAFLAHRARGGLGRACRHAEARVAV